MDKPIRIAQVINRMDSGGVEAVILDYYRHIDRSRVQFDFYFVADSTLPQRAEMERMGAGLYPLPPCSHMFSYHRALYRAFKARGYRIVHAQMNTISVFVLFAAWRAGVPVRICHDHSTAHWGEGVKALLKYLLRPINKWFATDWFACGERAGRWMYGDKAFDAGRVTVLPNAIEPAKFAFDPAARQCLRAELGIAPDAFVVGHVGRLTYAKNHRFLLEMFAELQKQRPDARLLLVGEGELEQRIRQQVRKLGLEKAVVFTGARADVNKLYSAMDVFCMPSNFEGMPLAAWEAQANGLPCILSDHITREAGCSANSVFCALERGAAAWADAVCAAERGPAAAVPDIAQCARRLEEFYWERETANDNGRA